MSMVETAIYIDADPVHEPEDRRLVDESNLVARLVFKDGWCSPNHYVGQHWARTKKVKDNLDDQAKAQFYKLPPEQRSKIVEALKSDPPQKRAVVIHIVKTRGPYPDIDNLVGGCKFLIDALKFRRQIRVPNPSRKTGYKIEYQNVGNPWIYDDSSDKFRLAEIYLSRKSNASWVKEQYPDLSGSCVIVDVYDEPS